jgi:hypothetical protein
MPVSPFLLRIHDGRLQTFAVTCHRLHLVKIRSLKLQQLQSGRESVNI